MVKLADLGDASICHNDKTLALLPKSKPWNAPEYHHRGFPFDSAVKMDVYSFGLFCLWVLFGNDLSLPVVGLNRYREDDCVTDGLPSTVATLAILKRTNGLQTAAQIAVYKTKEIGHEEQLDLIKLFALTLAEASTARTSDFQLILRLLGDER